MVKIIIDLDEQTAARLARTSEARHLSIESLLRLHAENLADREPNELPGRSHQEILSALTRPEGYYQSLRDKVHDREADRAEAYQAARANLLALIDGTKGDMGAQKWHRADLYDR